MRGLKDKVAIVTGGSSGIGRGCMERLCEEGCSVTFSGISDIGITTEKELLDKGYNVQFVQGDMGKEEFCIKLVEETVAKWGKVNFLVNNAFSFNATGLASTRSDWEQIMTVGPFAYAKMSQLCFPHMKEQGAGAIVNMSSISAHIAQPDRWTYNSAKGAVNQLTRCMAMDMAPVVRVNTCSPGWIWTREVDKAADADGGGREKWGPIWGKFHMLRRLGTVEECAAVTAFLLSDDASFVTADEIMVDGGYKGMGSEGLGEASSFAGSD